MHSTMQVVPEGPGFNPQLGPVFFFWGGGGGGEGEGEGISLLSQKAYYLLNTSQCRL